MTKKTTKKHHNWSYVKAKLPAHFAPRVARSSTLPEASSLHKSRPRNISSSIDEALAIVLRVEKILSARGLTVNSSSCLGALFAKIRLLERKAESLKDDEWRKIFLKANEGVWIARAIEAALGEEPASTQELFHRIVRTQVSLSDRQQSLGKDALWELDLYRRIKLGGSPVRFAEPDLVVSLGANIGEYSVACKKIYSEQAAIKRFKDACSQIKTHGRPGIVAFNLDDLVPENQVWTEPDNAALKRRLDDMNRSLILPNMDVFTVALERGDCDGIVFFTSVVAEILGAAVPITVARASAIWNNGASSGAKSRGEAFLKCLDQVIHS